MLKAFSLPVLSLSLCLIEERTTTPMKLIGDCLDGSSCIHLNQLGIVEDERDMTLNRSTWHKRVRSSNPSLTGRRNTADARHTIQPINIDRQRCERVKQAFSSSSTGTSISIFSSRLEQISMLSLISQRKTTFIHSLTGSRPPI